LKNLYFEPLIVRFMISSKTWYIAKLEWCGKQFNHQGNTYYDSHCQTYETCWNGSIV